MTSIQTNKSRPTVTGGADSRTSQQNPATTHILAQTTDKARRLADAKLVRDHTRSYLQGMRQQAHPNSRLTIADVEKLVLESEVAYAQAYVADLFERHGINDPTQAHRLLRERCTDTELHQFRGCVTLLDGQGVLG